MNKLSYGDLQWNTVILQPERYTIKDGELIPWGTAESGDAAVHILPEGTAVLSMPAGRGKITDSGYDQMVCLAAAVPVHDHVIFRGSFRIRRIPGAEEQNSQEGLGLFIRDTMEPDPGTGYPYANMIAGGVFHGTIGASGREGITEEDIESIRNISCSHDLPLSAGTGLTVRLEKQDDHMQVELAEEGSEPVRFEITVDPDIFASRDPERMYLGFLAARGCEMEADLHSVSIEFEDSSDDLPAIAVSVQGTPAGQGTPEDPLDLQTAVSRCRDGQRIEVFPGRYRLREDLVIAGENSGRRRHPRTITAVSKDEKTILDFGGTEHGFVIAGDCWNIRGLIVTGGYGFMIRGNHNYISHCMAAANLETGFLIRHPDNDSPAEQWPSYNVITDCVSCMNMDRSQQHADGFACKVSAGPGNRFVRCTAWLNSDDGFDLFSKNRPIGAVILEDCRSWLNGWIFRHGQLCRTAGNGSGFKLGGSGLAIDHEAVRCEAVGNRGYGFSSNSNPHLRISGCHAANNSRNFAYYFTGPQSRSVCVMDNCTESDIPDCSPEVWLLEHIAVSECLLPQRISDGDQPGLLIMCSSLYGGGAERVACRLACGLADSYRVSMLYVQDKGQTYSLDPGIQLFEMPRFEGPFETVMECRAAWVRLLKEKLGVSASISFMFTMNKLNVMSAGKEKVICSERNNPAKRDPEHLQEIEKIYEAADHVVFQTETVRSLFSEKVREHSSIILNPVSVSCQRRGGSHRIVNIGRLMPQKNQAMLIRAFALFHKTHNDYTLSIYGEGELKSELTALIESLGLSGAVRLHGQVREIHEAVADAEMFVLSSDYEGLSNALLEGMMMGFPCISTRCEGAADVISSGTNGILVDIGNKDQLAEAMAMLADHAAYREKMAAAAVAASRQFHEPQIIEIWKQLIRQISGL
ncbi:MAG: glycosyltransferase [Solobacterium sp.]|nr:glycosyltransferase [Solobacterium sp.]